MGAIHGTSERVREMHEANFRQKRGKMIDYNKVNRGDILKIVGAGAPGYAELGDLVRVTTVHQNSVMVEDRNGSTAEFCYNCGSARLEPTEWKEDFPNNKDEE